MLETVVSVQYLKRIFGILGTTLYYPDFRVLSAVKHILNWHDYFSYVVLGSNFNSFKSTSNLVELLICEVGIIFFWQKDMFQKEKVIYNSLNSVEVKVKMVF